MTLREQGISQHQKRMAIIRAQSLRRFYAIERENPQEPRWAIAARVAEEFKARYPGLRISAKSMQRWELGMNRHGVRGLLSLAGQHRKRPYVAAVGTETATPADELAFAADGLEAIARRLRRVSKHVQGAIEEAPEEMRNARIREVVSGSESELAS